MMPTNNDPLFAPCPPNAHQPDFYPSTQEWHCIRCGMPLRVTGLVTGWDEAVGKREKKEEERKA